jgi:hypothetical protein
MPRPESNSRRCRRCRQWLARDQFALIPRNDASGGMRRETMCIECRSEPLRRTPEYCALLPNLEDATGQTMLVPLSQGKFALIDSADADLVSPYCWSAMKVKNLWYAIASIKNEAGDAKMVLMHRHLLGGDSAHIDHRHGNGLDNRRHMIRPATVSENIANRAVKDGNGSGFKGVRRSSPNGGWTAYLKVMGVHIHLGTFTTAEEAARIRDARAVQEFGEFAWLNFPDRDAIA